MPGSLITLLARYSETGTLLLAGDGINEYELMGMCLD